MRTFNEAGLENAVKFYREFVYDWQGDDEKTRSGEVEKHCKLALGYHSRMCKILITFFS